MVEKLEPHRLRAQCCEEHITFETTAEVPPLEGIIGQDRAVQALAFGLRMEDEGYNIYVSGLTGTGRNSYTRSIVGKIAQEQPTPTDWCYVFDFERPDSPRAISFTPGQGAQFKVDVETTIERLKRELPEVFDSDEFKAMRSKALHLFQRKTVKVMEKLGALAKEHQLLLTQTGKGFITVPTVDGQPLNEQALQELDSTALKDLNARIQNYQEEAEPLFEELADLERGLQEKLQTLEKSAAASIVIPHLDTVRRKYKDNNEAIKHLFSMQQDIFQNLQVFWLESGEEEEEGPSGKPVRDEGWELRYKVNLFVDNSQTVGAPVIRESSGGYYNLMGMIEFHSNMGALVTDFTRIKAGSIHRANGGYLILQAEDLFTSPHTWKALKRALKNRESKVENVSDSSGGVVSGLKPQGIPLDLKVLIIGSYDIYMLLYHHDEDFKKYFKIKVDFETAMNRELEHVEQMAAFISRHCRDKGYRHFHRSAVREVIDYSSRLAEDQHKLSTLFSEIVELLAEANAWAELDESDLVYERHITKALDEKRYRSDKHEERTQELFEDGTFLISTDGFAVGQVNGLAVYDLGDYAFGKPSRITVNTFAGKKGVINIEKEAQLSGPLHNKGVLIITGYLGMKFAQKFPLTLTATLCFEQSYGGVDGDSASSTELYALLSSLSGLPINQGIAVTGSVNQKGEIQPIGGVNEKIEGYYRVCKRLGLTGRQGVLIPHQNVPNLMLHKEVVEAVENGQFHIYAAKTIEEGLELLTGVPAGKRNEAGMYPAGTVFQLVEKKLYDYYRQSLQD